MVDLLIWGIEIVVRAVESRLLDFSIVLESSCFFFTECIFQSLHSSR